MKKERVKKWAGRGVILFFVLSFFYLFVYKYIYRNLPSNVSLELQKKITETAGKGYEVWLPGPEETDIQSIYIDVDDDLLEDKKLFETCDKINHVIYDYAETHPQNFELFSVIDRESQVKYGFTINYMDSGKNHLYGGTDVVFWFSNYLKSKHKYDEGFGFMCAATHGVGGYGYQFSDLKVIRGVKELFLAEIDIDDVEVLGEMEDLEYFTWERDSGYEGEWESQRLEEAADKYGIKFETYMH